LTHAYQLHIYDDAGLVVSDSTYEDGQSGDNFASRSDKYLDGYGRAYREISYTTGNTLDFIDTNYDQVRKNFSADAPLS